MSSLLVKKCQDPDRNNICLVCEKFNQITGYEKTGCSKNKNKVKSEYE